MSEHTAEMSAHMGREVQKSSRTTSQRRYNRNHRFEGTSQTGREARPVAGDDFRGSLPAREWYMTGRLPDGTATWASRARS